MEKWEKAARDCYAEPIKLNKDKFVKMMLLDGCFIIELFRKFKNPTLRDAYDPIFRIPKIRISIRRDLLLFENQIPLFVLSRLFNMTENSNQGNPPHILGLLALNFFRQTNSNFPPPAYNHLLGLVHYAWYSSIAGNGPSPVIDTNHQFIKSVTKLQEAGIKFQKTESSSFLDVKFANGIMKIPSLVVDDDTECLFRNLIPYEQYGGGFWQTNMTDYTTFMDCLLKSPKDVEILRHYGIIDNRLGDDKVVSTMFNKLRNSFEVNVDCETFHYGEVFKEVNEYCKDRRHRWKAYLRYNCIGYLRYNYCNSPWTILSVIVAGVFLLLTVIQTVCSILQL